MLIWTLSAFETHAGGLALDIWVNSEQFANLLLQYIRSPVYTLCVGQAASMGSLLLTAGATGHRRSLPNARVMIHQPSTERIGGTAADIEIHAREILDMRTRLNKLYMKHTGSSVEKIRE